MTLLNDLSFIPLGSNPKPRHAVAYHFFNEEGTPYGVYEGIREVYDGPLSLATDMMAWNVDRDGITERTAVATEETCSVPGPRKPPAGKPGQVPRQLSEEILAGSWDVSDVEAQSVGDFVKKYDINPSKKN